MHQVIFIIQIAVTVDDHHNVSSSRPDAYVSAGAGPALGIHEEKQIIVGSLQIAHDGPGAVCRLAIDHDHLESLRVIMLMKNLMQCFLNMAGFIADGNDHGNKRVDRAATIFMLAKERGYQCGNHVVLRDLSPSVSAM